MANNSIYELIDDYLDNALSPSDRLEVEDRMAQDESFRRDIEIIREMRTHMRDPHRIKLRTTIHGVVRKKSENSVLRYMKSIYLHYAKALGERPLLVFIFLMALSLMFIERLIDYVLKSPRGVFGSEYSAPVMVCLVIITCGVLLWRLSEADRILRRMVLDKYREAIRLLDSNARSTVRDLAGRLGIGKNFYLKIIRLITLVPGPFLLMIAFLAAMNIILHLMINYFPHEPAGSIWEDIYIHTPWAIGTFALLYLIHNDILVVNQLRHLVESISVRKFADFFEHLEQFKKHLTEEERQVLDYFVRYPNLTEREIGRRLLGLSDLEVIEKHRQSILEKWRQYATQNNLSVRLEKLLTVFYVEYPGGRLYSASRGTASMN